MVALGWTAFVAITLGAWGWTVDHLRQEETARTATLAQQLTRQAVVHLSLILGQVEMLHLEMLSSDVDRLQNDLTWRAKVSADLRRMINGEPHMRNLGLVDKDGALIVEAEQDPPRSVNIADRKYFQTASADAWEQMVLSEPLIGRISGERAIAAARGRKYPNGDRLVATVVIDFSAYGGAIAALNLPASWSFSIWREDGVLLHRQPAAEHLLGRQILVDTGIRGRRMDPNGRVLLESSPINGDMRLVAAQKLRQYPLSVVMAVDQSWIFDQADARRRPIDYAIVALLVVGAAFFALLLKLQRKSEQVLAASQREAEAARREDAAKSAFLSHISHHLRTPLHAMVGFLDLLAHRRCDACPSTELEFLDHARCAGERMTYVVDRLMDFATIDGLDGRTAQTPFSLTPLVRAAAASIACEQEHLSVTLEIAPDCGLALGDPALAGRVLDALLSNAARFAAARVGVDLRFDHDALALRIWDDGPGFPDGWTSHGPLTLEAVYRHDGGMGMGLPIVRRLAETMGWTMSLGRAPEGGAEVRLRIQPKA